jgi:hypothetical protein
MSEYRRVDYSAFVDRPHGHCNALFPTVGLPPSLELTMVECPWYSSDSVYIYSKRGGHPIYGENDILYRFNSLGYRSPEPTDSGDIRMIAIGCSNTFGLGVREEERFSDLFADKLRADTGRSVVDWNFGFPGKSADYVARMLHVAVPALDPDVVLVFFPGQARRECGGATERVVDYLPNYKTIHPEDAMVFGACTRLLSELDDRLNAFRNYQSIRRLLRHRELLFTFRYYSPYQDCLSLHFDHSCWAPWPHGQDTDRARDGYHIGPVTHRNIAESFWETFRESGARDRLLARVEARRPAEPMWAASGSEGAA